MNDNTGETPNPLTNNQAGGGANSNPPQPSIKANTQPAATEAATTSSPVASLDPTGRTMEQKNEPLESPKKMNKGVIAAIVAGCAILIGGIVAAVLVMLNMNQADAVAAAMQKIMNNETPGNVAIDGTINILLNNEEVPFKRINIKLDSDISVGSMINTSSAVLTLTDNNDKDYSVKVNEVYADSKDLFFEIEGAKDALEKSGLLSLMSGDSNASDNLSETSSSVNNSILGVVEKLDGVYLRISSDELNQIKEQSLNSSSEVSCVTDLVSELDKTSDSAAQLYSKYPFIASSNENIPIPSKKDPIYLIWLDENNFTSYVNEMKNTEITRSLFSCLGWDNNVTITKEDVVRAAKQIPDIYAEINGDHHFTRLYLESDISNGAATATIDLNFDYPANVNASEPVEYKDFSEFMQTIFKSMYNIESSASSTSS